MTDFVLVRHGESTHRSDGYVGSTDVPLTDRGREQAAELAKWAASADLVGVWSSNLMRASHTAQASADALDVELQVDSRLREVDFGDAEGRTRDELKASIPDAFEAFTEDPVANHWPGGEDPAAAADRGLECLREVGATERDGRVLVVCHTTLIRLMMCSLLGIPLREYRRRFPFVHNGFLNEVRLTDGHFAMLSWNAPPADRGKTDDP